MEMLRKEYLNQTFNFLPALINKLDKGDVFEGAQTKLLSLLGKKLVEGELSSQGDDNEGITSSIMRYIWYQT